MTPSYLRGFLDGLLHTRPFKGMRAIVIDQINQASVQIVLYLDSPLGLEQANVDVSLMAATAMGDNVGDFLIFILENVAHRLRTQVQKIEEEIAGLRELEADHAIHGIGWTHIVYAVDWATPEQITQVFADHVYKENPILKALKMPRFDRTKTGRNWFKDAITKKVE